MMSGRRVAVLVALAAVAMAGAASSVGVIEIDEAGALHVNSSDPLAQPVLLNGQDVLSLVAAQASMIAEQESAGKDVESTLSELQQQNAGTGVSQVISGGSRMSSSLSCSTLTW